MVEREFLEKRARTDKPDRLFEIALLLISMLSASIYQYVWSKYSFDTTSLTTSQKLSDLGFLFKDLTIPIVFLILLWLLAEFVSGESAFLSSVKRIGKEICWTFLSIFLATEILQLFFYGFAKTPLPQVLGIMVLIAFLSTFAVTRKYGEPTSAKGKSQSPSMLKSLPEYMIVFALSYSLIVMFIFISALPSP